MRKLATKSNILIISIFALVIYFLLRFLIESDVCNLYLDECLWVFYMAKFFVSFIIFYGMFFFLRKEILSSWFQFAIFWALFTGWFIWVGRYPGFFFPGVQGGTTISILVLIFMSFALFAIKSWEFRRFDHGMLIKQWLKWFLLVLAFMASTALSIFIYGLIQ